MRPANLKGGLAGFFDGNVEVTARLDAPVIKKLEQRVSTLEHQLGELQERVGKLEGHGH